MDPEVGERDEKIGSGLTATGKSPYTLPQGYLSYSQVDLYIKCPKRYEYKYIDRRPSKTSSSQARGKTVHSVLEQLHRLRKHGEIPSWGLTKALLEDALSENMRSVEEWDDKVTSTEVARSGAEASLKLYVENRLPLMDVRAIETKVEIDINGRVPFLGYIDIIEDGGVDPAPGALYGIGDSVRDIKTTTKKYGPGEIQNSLQLSLYAGATGIHTVAYDLLITPPKGGAQYVEQVAQRTSAEVAHAYDVVEDVARAISAGVFPRTSPQNWMCDAKWCPFYKECRGRGATVATPCSEDIGDIPG